MCKLAPTNGASEPVRILCERIIVGQGDEIALMQSWLQDRGEKVPPADATHLRMTMDGMEHDMMVDGLRIEMVGKAAGGHHAGAPADTLVVHTMANENGSITFRTDQRGTYQFYCTLPGHRDAGMVGEMTVV